MLTQTNRRLFFAIAVVLWALPPRAFAADASEPVDLAPHWVAGHTSRYAFTTRLERRVAITLGDNQREQVTVSDITGEVTWVVDRVTADGGSRCTMTLDWMRMVTRAGDHETLADSRKSAPADAKVMHELLQAMAETPLAIVVAPDGRVERVDGLKAMQSQTDQPELIPEALDFIETASGMAQFAAAPPPLSVDDTWDAAFRWSHDMGHVDEDWRYRLQDVETVAGVRLATVTGTAKSKLDIDPEQLETPPGTPPLRIRLDQRDVETRVLMDLSRGEAVGRYSRVSEQITAEIKLPRGVFRRVMSETTTSDLIRLSETP